MSKMRKSLAVLSSAIAPILLAGSSASAGVNLNLVDNGTLTASTPWPNSTIGAVPVVESGSPTSVPPAGPGGGTPGNAGTMSPGIILAETFTTPSTGFNLGAISFVAGGGGPTDTTMGASIQLFQLGTPYTVTSGFYTLGNGGSEVGNELLGGGAGLPFNLRTSGNAIYEFDFNNTGTNDNVPLLPNTTYAIELWGASNSVPPATYFQRTGQGANQQSYTGGQAYQVINTGVASTSMVDHSTVERDAAGGSPLNYLFSVYSNSVVITGPSFWNTTSSGNWNVSSNWSSQSVPTGIGMEADFLSSTSTVNGVPPAKNGLTSNGNVYTDTPVTVGIMNFDNSNTYVLDGAGSLTVQVSTGTGQVNVLSGVQEINLPLTIASNTVLNVSSGATLKIANPVTVNSGLSLTASGSGSVIYQSIVTLQAGASLAIPNSTFANTLSLASGSTATVTPHGANPVSLLQLENLSLGSGTLNLSNNDMIVHSGGSSLATVTAEIAQGRNGGSTPWTGSAGAITSSTAAANSSTMALGVELNDNGSGSPLVTSFEGQPTADGDILVKYTYAGDADLSGSVSAADYLQIDNGFQNHLAGWHNGDFNYDGVINGDDYTLIDNSYNSQGSTIIAVTSAGPEETIASPTELIATPAVPEPTSLSLLGIGSAVMFMRRRRTV